LGIVKEFVDDALDSLAVYLAGDNFVILLDDTG
jgi:hypothetical protein